MDGLCIVGYKKNAKLGTGRSSQGIEGYGGGKFGDEGLHWAVVLMKKLLETYNRITY